MSRPQVDSIGDVAPDDRDRLVDRFVRKIKWPYDARAAHRKSALMHLPRRLRVSQEPANNVGANDPLRSPLLAMRDVILRRVGIVARSQPRQFTMRRGSHQLKLGCAERAKSLIRE